MIAPLIKSENCIKIFKLVEKSLEEYSSNNKKKNRLKNGKSVFTLQAIFQLT